MPSVSIIGLGPWGLAALERLVDTARRHRCAELVVHVIEPGRPGGGMYSAPQPDYLVLNTPCGQHSLYPFLVAAQEERLGLGFYEWAKAQGYRWDGVSARRGEAWPGSRPVAPDDFLPRRLMGEYLEWFYGALRTEAPANVSIVHHPACAVNVQRLADGRERAELDDGSTVVVDDVIMTVGHGRERNGGGQSKTWVTEPYPLGTYAGAVQPCEKVAIEGMGLVALDVVTALTIGLGGRYVPGPRRTLRYLKSGREPELYLFSRSGYPYCAKPLAATDPAGTYQPAICTIEAVAHLKGALGHKRQMDARTELLPLVFAEMELCYYTKAIEQKDGVAAAERARRLLLDAWAAGAFAHERARLAQEHGDFSAHDYFFVGEGEAYCDAADYQARVYQTVAVDVAEALAGSGSAVKAAIETLRALRDTLRTAVEFKGLTYESHLDFVANLRSKFARLIAGPPAFRSQELLALVDAGVVKMPFGPRPDVTSAGNGKIILRSMHLRKPFELVADRFVRAHLELPSLARSGSPLLSNLVAGGRVRPLDFDGAPAGSLDLTEDFHPVNADGEPERHLWVFGVLSEGARYFTLYIPSPKTRVRAFLDLGEAAEQILAAQRTTVADVASRGNHAGRPAAIGGLAGRDGLAQL